MAPYEEKGKIMKFFSYLARNNVFVFVILIIASLFLAVLAWYFLPVYFSLGISLIIIVGLVIFTSYKKDLSIPLIRTFLRKEYFLVKFKYFSGKNYLGFRDGKKKNKQKVFARLYLKVINYLILLFENSEESFHTLKEDAFTKLDEILEKTEEEKMDDKFRRIKQTIKKIKTGEEVDPASLSELEKELFEFSKFKQKKATVFSLTAITALIITTVTAGLISSFLFPEVFKTKAASYGFLQTSWAGGASSDNATHSNQTGWTKYLSKDNVSTTTPTELKLSLTTTTIFTQTSDSDWQTHATSSTYYTGGSVGVLRPNGSACSAAVECSSGYCYVDADGDRYAPASGTATCRASSQLSNTDCNDGNASIYPTTTGGSTCSYCNTDGSITYQTNAQDLFSECTASGCTTTGNCSGTGYSCGGNATVDTDPNNACSTTTCTDYIYGWSGNNCAKYSGSSSHNGMCNGSGACYTTVADSCSGVGSTSASCGSAGCQKACVAGGLATSYDTSSEVCYVDSATHGCGCQLCNSSGTCATMTECLAGDAIGTVCGGGIKFSSGLVAMPSGCADSTNEPTCSGTDSITKQWAGMFGYNEPADSTSDGETNTTGLVNDAQTTNPAAQYCYDMAKNCYSDWYLPAKDQLNTLYGQKATVGGFASYYWSSTEYSLGPNWSLFQYFTNGIQADDGKTASYSVRCIRTY